MSVSITHFGNGHTACYFYEAIGDEPLTSTQVDLQHAQRLMWELVLAGAKRSTRVNSLDPSICSADTYIFLPY